MAEPALSVVLPTHSRPDLLRRSAASVLAQTRSDLELVVVDDASPSPSELPPEIEADARVRWVRRSTNGGPAAARNSGIEVARAPLISFLDDDDEYEPQFASTVIDAFENDPEAGFGWTGVRWVNDEGSRYRVLREEIWNPRYADREEAYLAFLKNRRVGTNCGLTVRADLFDRVGTFEDDLRCGEDSEFLLRAVREAAFVVVPEVLVTLHIHAGPRARHAVAANLSAYEVILERHGDTLADHEDIRAALHYKCGWMAFHAGDPATGRRYFRRAVRDGARRGKTLLAWGLLEVPWFGTRMHRWLSSFRASRASGLDRRT